MNFFQFRTRRKIAYLIKARHRGGHGIHSPFLFRLITRVIENRGYYSAYTRIKAAANNVEDALKMMDPDHFRMPQLDKGIKLSSNTSKTGRLPERFDLLFFRLVNEFQPERIGFYGSTSGVTLLALALADSRIKVRADVPNERLRTFCRRLAEVYDINNIELPADATFEPAGFVVIREPEIPAYCDSILDQLIDNQVFQGNIILCDIHDTPAMEQIWEKYKRREHVRIALDLFEAGILICNNKLQKESFVLRF